MRGAKRLSREDASTWLHTRQHLVMQFGTQVAMAMSNSPPAWLTSVPHLWPMWGQGLGTFSEPDKPKSVINFLPTRHAGFSLGFYLIWIFLKKHNIVYVIKYETVPIHSVQATPQRYYGLGSRPRKAIKWVISTCWSLSAYKCYGLYYTVV